MHHPPPGALRAGLVLLLAAFAPALHAQTAPAANDRVRTVADSLRGAVGGVAVDAIGMIYVADFGEKVFRVTPSGEVSVFARGLYGASGNCIDAQGRLLQSNFSGHSISRIDRLGHVETFAEGLQGPVGIAIDRARGDAYVCNCRGNSIARVSPAGEVSEFAKSDLLNCPNGIAFGPDSNLYVVNFSDGRMLKITRDGRVAEHAVVPGGGNGHVAAMRGALYATSFRGHRIYRVTLDGEVAPFAGSGSPGELDGPALEAQFTSPNGIAAGPTGDRLYVNDFINRFPPTVEAPPQPLSSLRQITLASFSSHLAAALEAGGIEAMESAYRAWKNAPATASLFTEVEVNVMGYQLMGAGQLAPALRLLELNAESHPQSANAWDSLAEAHMKSGHREKAIEMYRKSLELNPANTNARNMLKTLGES